MRHTRNRQLKRYNRHHIIFCIGNLPINFIRKYAYEDMYLDSTFKWNRNGCKNQYVSWLLPIDIFIEDIAFVKEARK